MPYFTVPKKPCDCCHVCLPIFSRRSSFIESHNGSVRAIWRFSAFIEVPGLWKLTKVERSTGISYNKCERLKLSTFWTQRIEIRMGYYEYVRDSRISIRHLENLSPSAYDTVYKFIVHGPLQLTRCLLYSLISLEILVLQSCFRDAPYSHTSFEYRMIWPVRFVFQSNTEMYRTWYVIAFNSSLIECPRDTRNFGVLCIMCLRGVLTIHDLYDLYAWTCLYKFLLQVEFGSVSFYNFPCVKFRFRIHLRRYSIFIIPYPYTINVAVGMT